MHFETNKSRAHANHPFVLAVVETFLSIHRPGAAQLYDGKRTYTTGFPLHVPKCCRTCPLLTTMSFHTYTYSCSNSVVQSALCQKSSKSLADIYTYIFLLLHQPSSQSRTMFNVHQLYIYRLRKPKSIGCFAQIRTIYAAMDMFLGLCTRCEQMVCRESVAMRN